MDLFRRLCTESGEAAAAASLAGSAAAQHILNGTRLRRRRSAPVYVCMSPRVCMWARDRYAVVWQKKRRRRGPQGQVPLGGLGGRRRRRERAPAALRRRRRSRNKTETKGINCPSPNIRRKYSAAAEMTVKWGDLPQIFRESDSCPESRFGFFCARVLLWDPLPCSHAHV